ncbi:DNA modification methylase [Desulfosarcina widdelii]|uniref:Methyltransferase n=1 Tax=Desulfosarcina widdelii TaxID=947919 RepID=A0A5K7Z0G4_9BACT|nr:site-specific DNA-methyltransferase [Desulfosarcina widdelii]BBO73643.1 DNA modification methylase [Desulfosarcina widdelii]
MQTEQQVVFADAARMSGISSRSVHLAVTSPPYPMIEMWDAVFCCRNETKKALRHEKGMQAFESMHRDLDRVWKELDRVLVPGGIACINIGDATRTLDGEFALYPNHSRILSAMLALGFTNLPNILWRKQTNAPNKFMGSGMMPPGAYVTLEHEYVLILRKGGKRLFNDPEAKTNRRQSAFFWEERNHWFSDVWMDLKGTRQNTGDKKLRQRSGAYPVELAYRLISMFSVMGDTVLDPFLGTGTTLWAAAAAGRNGIGYEMDSAFAKMIGESCRQAVPQGRHRIAERLDAHLQFVREREENGKPIKYTNQVYGFPVITRQETELLLPLPVSVEESAENRWQVKYDVPMASAEGKPAPIPEKEATPMKAGQLSLFN